MKNFPTRLVRCGLVSLMLSTDVTVAETDYPRSDSSGVDRKALYRALGYGSAYYAGAIFTLQNTWYRDRERVPFHFYDDNRGYLQVDKFGHAFGAYVQSYIGYHWMRSAGMPKTRALLYGGPLGLVLQTPVEIMDGTHEGWGFSWGDMVANAMGSGLLVGQEILFDEQTAKYKFSYWESPYSRKANGYLGENAMDRLLTDYNGHTYWLSVPVIRLIRHAKLPPWLCISAGYSANGMYGEYENISSHGGVAIPKTRRYRQYLISLDVDWTKIETRSKPLHALLQAMAFVKLTFPAIEFNSKGGFEGYWLYY